MRQMLFLIAVAAFMAILLGVAVYYVLRARRAARNAWALLLGRLQQIDRDNFAAVALDLLEDSDAQLDPDRIFEMIGGMSGLDALEQNCDVLIDLAAYVQRWYPEALQIAEELRLNAREIKWHIGRLRGASQTGHLREQFPVYAQRAVATYYLMTRSLLVLYEGVHLPEYAELQRAI
jgi:archaellum biogenesis protein FlaJ (TadC family)